MKAFLGRVNYKSGNSVEFEFTKFRISHKNGAPIEVEWYRISLAVGV